MKKLSKTTIVLWVLAVLFFLVSFSFIGDGNIGAFITGVVIAAVLGFIGWKKSKANVSSTTATTPTMPKVEIIKPQPDVEEYTEDAETEEIEAITIYEHSIGTIKALKNFNSYVVIDFETTGFSAKKDKAIEIACLKCENGEFSEFQTLIDPHTHISSRITKINGITDDDVVGFPDIVEVAKQVYTFCGTLPLVAHNATFDMSFLRQAYIEAGLEVNTTYVDTLKLSRKAFPEYQTHKLEYLIQELGLADKQTHRAMDDVRCTQKLLEICLAKIIEQKENAKRERAAAKLQNQSV